MSTDELTRLADGITARLARLTGGATADGPAPDAADAAGGAAATEPAAPEEPATGDQPTPTVHGPRVAVSRTATMTAGRPDTAAHLDDLVRRFTTRTAESKRLAARHRAVLADSRATVGFRSSTKEMLYPLAARRARGAGLTDVDGNDYVDITMGFGTLLFGHEPDWLTDAVRAHLDGGLRVGPRSPETGEAAELLAGLTGMDRVAFTTSGTEANTSAIRLARAATGRSRIVMFQGAYHGHADATLGRTTGRGAERRTVPVASGIAESAMADLLVLDYGAPESLRAIEEHADQIAMVLVEPVQSRNPALRPVPFVQELRELTRRHGIVLLFDEMLTGLRPHPRGAQELYGVVPDLATYGKLLGGGFPIGAIAGRAELLDGVDGGPWEYGDDSYPRRETTFIGGTYLQHPLSMAAAKAVLSHLTAEGPALQERLNARTQRLADTLNGFFEEEEFPLRLAHYGSMFRFEHRANMELLYHHLVLRGVYVWEWRNFFLSTAHTDADVERVADAVTGSLRELRDAGFFRPRATPGRRTGTPATTAPVSAPATPATAAPRPAPDLSLYFFGDYPEGVSGAEAYDTMLRAARYADERGFHAVWVPERHFHSFGGAFPNPSVLAAALARETTSLRVNAGSVVLPLHDPIRVAEEWSVVDNLSGGRAGIGCASGWNSRDFVLHPERYADRRDLMYEQLAEVRALWRGETLHRAGGDGPAEVRLFPRPVQPEVPMFTAVVGNPDSYLRAARHDLGVVTNLMSQTPEQLEENIVAYRRARAEHGLDPAAGRVVVLLHTYLAADHDTARRDAYEPLLRYMRSSLALFGQVTGSLGRRVAVESLSEDDLDAVFSRAYDRYCDQRALIGSPESVAPVIDRLRRSGVDEVAALVDFGVPADSLLNGLPMLDTLRRRLSRDDAGSDSGAGSATVAASGTGTAPPATDPAPATSGAAPGGAAAPTDAVPSSPAEAPTTSRAGTDPGTSQDHPTGPLSPGQRRIWTLDQLLPGGTAYHEPAAVALDGPLDVPALRRALEGLVHRHEALRTVFPTVDGEPHQRVLPAGPDGPGAVHRLTVTDAAELVAAYPDPVESDRDQSAGETGAAPDDDRPEPRAARAALRAEEHLPFDLAAGPLFRARLLRTGDQRHVLVLCFHHIVVDAVSAGVLTRDLAALYRAELAGTAPDLPDLTTTYRDVAARQRAAAEGPESAADLAHWRRVLGGDLPVLRLPTDRPRPAVMTTRGAHLERRLDPDLTRRLGELARRQRVTPFMVLLAGYAAMLHAVTGEEDLVIGTPVADRPDGTDDLVGFFVNTVALRLDLTGDPGFDTLLRQVRGTALDAYDHAATPFDTVLREIAPPRDTAHTPVFQVIAEYEGGVPFPLDLPDLTAETLAVGADRALTDLAVYFTADARGTACRLEYNADLFDVGTVDGFHRRLERILRTVVEDPGTPLAALAARPAAAGPRRPVPATTVPELVARQAADTPDRTAVTTEHGALTYRQLDQAARRLAARLTVPNRRAPDAAGGAPEPVALWLPRSAEFVVAALAVLRAGRAYLPLDPALGPQRVPDLLADGGATTLVTGEGVPVPPGLPDAIRVVRTPAAATLAAEPDDPPAAPGDPTPDAVCCVLYTSGTEGRPKGVALTHRGLTDLCQWQHRRFATGPDSRAAAVCSQSFDATLLEVWPALTAGGSVAVAPDDVRLDPRALSRWYAREGVTFSVLPTALGTQVLALPAEAQPPLRHLLCGGEELTRRPRPEAPYETVNVYGPTETTVLVTEHSVAAEGGTDDGPVPLGRPRDNVRLHILDDAGHPVPDGATGELYVGGPGVASGYHRDPARTADRFVPDPGGGPGCLYRTGDLVSLRPDGTLRFHGRQDEQVKIRGFRVEPSEAAHALLALPEVRDGAVVARRDASGDTVLAGYVVATEPVADEAAFLAGVRKQLDEALPEYLVPRTWDVLPALPLTVNGKLDRAALPPGTVLPDPDPDPDPDPGPVRAAAPAAPSDASAPPGAVAARLRQLWADELGATADDLADDVSFFALGGDSIKAIRLVNRVSEEFATEYPVIRFFQEPTLAAMAGQVAQPDGTRVRGEV